MLYIIELQKVFDAHATHKIQTILTSQSTKYTIFGYPSNESIETALADFDIFSLNCDITYTLPPSIKRIHKFDKEKHKHTLTKTMFTPKHYILIFFIFAIIIALFQMLSMESDMKSKINDLDSIRSSLRSEIKDLKAELQDMRWKVKKMKEWTPLCLIGMCDR
eukprot:GHVL01006306.1.p1 GENE.GHVL01006306.1~~GHVL01006306.1.p1  ORF type:complete len:163 (+),score=21.84 GHVL01006306.1:723-1211(+)